MVFKKNVRFLSSSERKSVKRELKKRASVTRKGFKGLDKVSRSKLKFRTSRSKTLRLEPDFEEFEEFMF